ncbi:MAG: GNAT family N-acetyltransferase [bacterium]|nr:GNAT family N-acetyltransferase [bacterium]
MAIKAAVRKILSILRIRRFRMVFFRLDMETTPRHPPPVAEEVGIERISLEAAESFKDYEDNWLTRAAVIERILNGHDLFVVRRGSERANYNWVLYRGFYIYGLDHWFELPERCAYLCGTYTPQAYRRQGLSRLNHLHIFEYLRGRGVRTLFLIVVPDNEPSLANVRKLGFEEYQRGGVLRLGTVWFYHFDGPRGRKRLVLVSRRPNERLNQLAFTDFIKGEEIAVGASTPIPPSAAEGERMAP